jgi:hypothetical protein
VTRAACQEHVEAFMDRYPSLTAGVPVNLYAIAEERSLVDFDQYADTMRGEVEFVTVRDPRDYGIECCAGALLTGERHILTDKARAFFETAFTRESLPLTLRTGVQESAAEKFDWTIDCTFAAKDAAGVERYEPCVVAKMEGPTDVAVTIMDGPFHSLYPWDEKLGICSLSSARWTPFSKACRTYAGATGIIQGLSKADILRRCDLMIQDMAQFYPRMLDTHKYVGAMLSVRAMPASAADTRLVDVRQTGERDIVVRAGKIDAVIHAEREIFTIMGGERP